MSNFDDYRARIGFHGGTYKDAIKAQSIALKEATFRESISWKTVYIGGESYDARIHQDVSTTVKSGSGNYKIEFRAEEHFFAGTYVEMENDQTGIFDTWLIMDNSDDLHFPLHSIKKCTRTLKWMDDSGKVQERKIAFDDTYKLYDGVRTYDNFTTLPDSTMNFFMPYDPDTIKLRFDTRFLIDADGLAEPEAWKVVNRNAVSRVYNGNGVIMLSVGKDQFNHEIDNAELMIADYCKTPTKPEQPKPDLNAVSAVLSYKGQPKIVAGAPAKKFELQFFDRDSNKIEGLNQNYEVLILPELQQFFKYEKNSDGKLSVAVDFNENVINYKFKIVGYSDDGSIKTELMLKVVSGV